MATVLVVDDDRDIREMLTVFLEACGYAVHTAEDGVEAIQMVEVHRIDLILMDLNMPRMNGWETTICLKQNPSTRAIPVIAITAYGLGKDLYRAWKAGINGFLAKPLDLDILLATVQEHLSGKVNVAPVQRFPVHERA